MANTYSSISKQNKNTASGLPGKKSASYKFKNLNKLFIIWLFNDVVSTTVSTSSNEIRMWTFLVILTTWLMLLIPYDGETFEAFGLKSANI
jgi:hypothetical protein